MPGHTIAVGTGLYGKKAFCILKLVQRLSRGDLEVERTDLLEESISKICLQSDDFFVRDSCSGGEWLKLTSAWAREQCCKVLASNECVLADSNFFKDFFINETGEVCFIFTNFTNYYGRSCPMPQDDFIELLSSSSESSAKTQLMKQFYTELEECTKLVLRAFKLAFPGKKTFSYKAEAHLRYSELCGHVHNLAVHTLLYQIEGELCLDDLKLLAEAAHKMLKSTVAHKKLWRPALKRDGEQMCSLVGEAEASPFILAKNALVLDALKSRVQSLIRVGHERTAAFEAEFEKMREKFRSEAEKELEAGVITL